MGRPRLGVAGLFGLVAGAGAELIDIGEGGLEIEKFVVHRAPYAPDRGPIELHSLLAPAYDGSYQVRVHARAGPRLDQAGRPPWELAVESVVRAAASPPAHDEPEAAEPAATIASEAFYKACERAGIAYGPSLRVIDELHVGVSRATGHLTLPEASGKGPAAAEVQRAAVLVGALQTVEAMMSIRGDNASVVRSIDRVWIGAPTKGPIALTVSIKQAEGSEPYAWAILTDPVVGAVVARLDGIRVRPDEEGPTWSHDAGSTRSRILDMVRDAAEGPARLQVLLDYLNRLVGAILRCPRDRALEIDQPLSRMGLDSLMAVQLSGAVQVELGRTCRR